MLALGKLMCCAPEDSATEEDLADVGLENAGGGVELALYAVGWPGRLARKPGPGGHRESRNSDSKRRCRGHGARTRS